MALRNNNVNMADGGNTHDRSKLRMQQLKKADGGNTHDRSKLRMQQLKKAEPEQPERRMQQLKKKKTSADTSSLTQELERAKEFGQAARSGSVLGAAKSFGNTVTRPAGNTLRKPSAGLNPVKPATQTQGRKKNDPWNSPW